MHIRRLPGDKGPLLNKDNFPQNHVFFNPSAHGQFVYIRCTAHSATEEKNYILIHNNETKMFHKIESPFHLLEPTHNLFQGLEDLRIVTHNGVIWFTATCTHGSKNMTNEMLVGHFNHDITAVERLSVLNIGKRPVKNICPFVWKDCIHLLDTYEKKIYKVNEIFDEDSNDFIRFEASLVKSLRSASGIPIQGFRGSTSPVHLHGNTWGFIVHDIIFNDNLVLVTRLAYYHHWVEMDIERGVITYFSSPFWIQHWGIEYVSGIRYNALEDPNKVEIFFGIQDRMPFKCTTSLSDLRVGK